MPYILPVNKHLIKKEIFSLLVNEKEFSPIIMKCGKLLQSMKYKLKTAFGKIGKHFRHRFIAKLFYTYSFAWTHILIQSACHDFQNLKKKKNLEDTDINS